MASGTGIIRCPILSDSHKSRFDIRDKKENRNLGGGGMGYVKTQPSFILFIVLTTTCFGHCGPSSGHKNVYRGKLYRV